MWYHQHKNLPRQKFYCKLQCFCNFCTYAGKCKSGLGQQVIITYALYLFLYILDFFSLYFCTVSNLFFNQYLDVVPKTYSIRLDTKKQRIPKTLKNNKKQRQLNIKETTKNIKNMLKKTTTKTEHFETSEH